jgi:hypothetical protein
MPPAEETTPLPLTWKLKFVVWKAMLPPVAWLWKTPAAVALAKFVALRLESMTKVPPTRKPWERFAEPDPLMLPLPST